MAYPNLKDNGYMYTYINTYTSLNTACWGKGCILCCYHGFILGSCINKKSSGPRMGDRDQATLSGQPDSRWFQFNELRLNEPHFLVKTPATTFWDKFRKRPNGPLPKNNNPKQRYVFQVLLSTVVAVLRLLGAKCAQAANATVSLPRRQRH